MDRRVFLKTTLSAVALLSIKAHASSDPVKEMARDVWFRHYKKSPEEALLEQNITSLPRLRERHEFDLLSRQTVWVRGELLSKSELAWLSVYGEMA